MLVPHAPVGFRKRVEAEAVDAPVGFRKRVEAEAAATLLSAGA
jgi:hypothetical protein